MTKLKALWRDFRETYARGVFHIVIGGCLALLPFTASVVTSYALAALWHLISPSVQPEDLLRPLVTLAAFIWVPYWIGRYIRFG